MGAVLLLAAMAAATSVAADTAAEPSRYALTAWAAEDGEPPGDVFAIAQDTGGFLWLGTPTGLIRFDGTRFTRWPPPGTAEMLPDGPVHAIVGAPDGSLWVGFGGGGGVVQIRDDRIVRHTVDSGAPPGVTAMLRDRGGAIWVAARRGLFRYADGRWITMGASDGYPVAEAFSVFEDSSGHLWVGTAVGVFRRRDTSFELVDGSSWNVQSLAEDGSGGIWITDPQHIVKRLPGRTPAPGAGVRLPAGAWRLLHDARGQIWVAAFGGGLLRITDAESAAPRVDRFPYEHRLSGSPRALFEDSEHNIWVGMRGGLLRLSEGAFRVAQPLEGLTNDGVRTTVASPDGVVWVATGHALNRYSEGSHQTFDVAQTMALHADRHGRLWISTGDAIGRLEGGRLVPVPVPDARRVVAMTTDAQDRLWLCSALRGVSVWNGTQLIEFARDVETTSRGCQSIHTDRRGRVWIGFLGGGVAVHERDAFHAFSDQDGVTPGTVLGLLEDDSGRIWLSTSTGVSRFADGGFVSLTRAHAPLKDIVPVFVQDRDGYLWVGVNSGAGIIRFHPDEMEKVAMTPSHQIEYVLFDESDGMQQGSQAWQSGVGGVRGSDGRLWVATGLGLVIIDPGMLPLRPMPRAARIDAVTANGRRVTPLGDVTFPAGTSTINIEYGATSLSSASKLRFRYRLEGLDERWVYGGALRETTYTNLPVGDYRFRVSATVTGRWTESAIWAFSVAPPFHQTREFLILALGGFALAVAGGWMVRLRAARNQYALVLAERTRVSREIHDTLLQSLAAIGVEIETVVTQLDPGQTAARDSLRRLRRQVSRSVREARDSILELRHAPMRQSDLAESLSKLAETAMPSRGVPVEFHLIGRARTGPADADMQLLRIGQEAMTNACKHAAASVIRITLRYEPDRVTVTVSDNGRGFTPAEYDPPPASGEHLGLLTMRERAARVRGRVSITSRPGEGTTVEAVVPFAME